MSKIIAGIGASHTTLMNTRWDEVDHLPKAHAFRDGLAEASELLAALNPDLIVIVGSNHFRGFWLDLMPQFTLGVDEVVAVGEHGTPKGSQTVDPSAALSVCESLLTDGFDAAFSTRLQVDHGISHAIQYLCPDGVPVLPVVINAFAPPLPSLARCLSFGDALRTALRDLPGDRKIAVIGSGGLAHQIPFPDWRSPDGEAEEFLAESFREGRGRWSDYEERRRPIVVNAKPRLNLDFDEQFLTLMEAGELQSIPSLFDQVSLELAAGNGGNEIRAWLVMAAALDHARARRIAYSAMPEWLTGMAVTFIDSSQAL